MNVDLQAASNYGEALFEAARDQDAIGPVLEDINVLIEAFAMVPNARHVLEAPHVSPDRKEAYAKAFLADFHPLVRNFVLLLLRRDRMPLFADAKREFVTLAERAQGKWEGTVTSAVSLDDAQKAALQDVLQRQTGRSLVLEYQVDPTVIGGIVFKSGDLLIDNSIATQLARLREKLMAAKVY